MPAGTAGAAGAAGAVEVGVILVLEVALAGVILANRAFVLAPAPQQ